MGIPHRQEEKAHVAIKGSEVGPVHVLKFPSSPPKAIFHPPTPVAETKTLHSSLLMNYQLTSSKERVPGKRWVYTGERERKRKTLSQEKATYFS